MSCRQLNGRFGIGRINDPLLTDDGTLLVAPREDLLATKLKVLLQRIEAKDYLDIAALLEAGVSLERLRRMEMEIRTIRSEADHRAALREIEALWNAAPGSEEAEKLELLSILVERYESARWPTDMSHLDPIDLFRFLIDDGGHTQAELAELLGSRSRASEILTRKRALTVEMIRKICEAWKVPAELMIRDYELAA